MEFNNNNNVDQLINERKDTAVLLQRISKTAGRIICGSPKIVGKGMIFDPVTGSVGGISF